MPMQMNHSAHSRAVGVLLNTAANLIQRLYYIVYSSAPINEYRLRKRLTLLAVLDSTNNDEPSTANLCGCGCSYGSISEIADRICFSAVPSASVRQKEPSLDCCVSAVRIRRRYNALIVVHRRLARGRSPADCQQ